MAKRGRPKKDQFSELDDDFKNALQAMGPEEIRKKIAEVAMNDEALKKAKDDDQDLRTKGEEYKVAGAVYREGNKANRLRIKFAMLVLEGKGQPAGDSGLP